MIHIIGIKVTDRIKEIGLTQEVISRHSSVITTRLGFHELTTEKCSREAFIILHLSGEPSEYKKLIHELGEIGGIEIREMNFEEEAKLSIPNSIAGGTRILGILIERNFGSVAEVQKTLTSFGCVIRTRLGVNEHFFGRPAGLIILELNGDESQIDLLEKNLAGLNKVHIRKMIF